jgi:hypothetical protein
MGGATSNILINPESIIYISYNKTEKLHTDICEKLSKQITTNSNFHVLTSKNIEELSDIKYDDFAVQFGSLIQSVFTIIICISPDYLQCFQQTKELNNILERSSNLIFIMMENTFTPLTNTELNIFIKNNTWITIDDINNNENKILSYLS